MNRRELSDQPWARLAAILPPINLPTGHPNLDHRPMINGMLWINRTGAAWRDLPERDGQSKPVSGRFYRWQQAGIGQRILDNWQAQAASQGKLDWAIHYGDGTIVRAHQHAAGAKGSQAATEALGRRQGGFSTKVHGRADGHGKPLTFVLTAGQRPEPVACEQLMTQAAVPRLGRGRPKQRPRRRIADKGYSTRKLRAYRRRRGSRQTIPHKSNEHRSGPFNRAVYRSPNLVERLINRLKPSRRLATRDATRADN